MKHFYLLISLACLAFSGCSKDPGENNSGKNAQIILPEESMTVNIEEGGTHSTLTFTAKSNWSVSVQTVEVPDPQSSVSGDLSDFAATKAPASWLKVEPMSGPAGEVTLTIEVPVYFADKERIADLTLTSGNDTKTVRVFQWAVPPIILSSLTIQQNSLPGVVPVRVSRNTDKFSVQIEEGAAWLTQQPTDSEYPWELYFDVAGNPELNPRRGVIRITDDASGLSQNVEVYQFQDPSPDVIIADEAFRTYLLANFDFNKDGRLSELEAKEVSEMKWDGLTIASLGELSLFPNLAHLSSENASLPALDLTGNPKLVNFSCTKTKVPSISLHKNPALEKVSCQGNPDLVSLTLGDVPVLWEMDCQQNPKLATLTFGKAEKLTEINCSENALTSLDVSGAAALYDLRCNKNRLTRLNVLGCQHLHTLIAKENLLSSLDCPGLEELVYLIINDNSIEKLDVTGCKALTNLNCQQNQLNDLFLSSCIALEEVLADQNLLDQIDIKGCKALRKLTFNNNHLISLNTSGNPALYVLYCDNNALDELDLSANTALGYLNCSDNPLTSLIVNAPETLEALHSVGTPLEELDFGGYAKLNQLWVNNNLMLATLNLSGCAKLSGLDLRDTSLTDLDLSDSPNLRPENVDLRNTPLKTLKYYNSLCGKANGWWGDQDPVTGKFPYPVVTYAH